MPQLNLFDNDEEEEPCSPKVSRKSPSRRNMEKRAYTFVPTGGERLFSPESHPDGTLLLRPNGSFAYVHDEKARFTEGVQGEWLAQPGHQVTLEPKSFGWCYEECFKADEILGHCYTITLCEDGADLQNNRAVCKLPDDIVNRFTWLDPTKEGAPEATTSGDDEEPCSPKVPRKKRIREKRAHAHAPVAGERLFHPESHESGLLLLRPNGSFAYVHDAQAKFSEGVQGQWREQSEGAVDLEPLSFGWCYEESFDAEEIVGVCHKVRLTQTLCGDKGYTMCVLPAALIQWCSWLDPTLPDTPELAVAALAVEEVQEEEEVEPCSPKIPARKLRRSPEKQAARYEPGPGEQIFCPASHMLGLLLLRPDSTFVYVHTSDAKFSDGVQGSWSPSEGSKVLLQPQRIGWCYQEAFDADEILGVCPKVTLCKDEVNENGRMICTLEGELLTKFSWMDPTLPE
mmetsp:Transcript_73351/g.132080  ORF Transcript_73351/g.132080 Transcript_73351/m.132080 type:complete len:456 (+) Transcript_73351:202-1569(+)|eukprot:CAMPEP_0115065380 /NCGR_PEP_ID=MMETSP0227-20121206/10220_1 /TAXON_ID=89957 /ORGANISM="Polarella glacialis, Strain CCMP 1383" /LENGTH=455 /DNA_ID=CAMNT_0002451165 /DNA_START=144 /DNA_END=1511 /DNA_ORIENTATION=+